MANVDKSSEEGNIGLIEDQIKCDMFVQLDQPCINDFILVDKFL